MKNGILLPSLLAAVSVWLGAGCATPENHPVATQEADWPKEKVNAPALFVENCARCHGLDGKGHTSHGWMTGSQNLTDVDWQIMTRNEDIIHAIRAGPSVMPAFQNKLSDAEIEALAAYVRTFRARE